jgi:NAD(P)-dependent dehydrogenase (short-subunit alcohol dehydrogenase family)
LYNRIYPYIHRILPYAGLHILKTQAGIMTSPDKTVIITGGNTGLGYACARHILLRGPEWHVVIACRNVEKAQKAREQLIAGTGNRHVDFEMVDLASLASVRQWAKAFPAGPYPPLYGLVCNAGLSLGDTITKTEDGIETTFQVNCLSHFLLVQLLLPMIQKGGRILFVSSELHRNDGPMKSFRPEYKNPETMAFPQPGEQPMKGFGQKQYSATKLCLLFYTYELARRLAEDKDRAITVNAFNPGLMPDTGLGGLNKMHFTRYFLKYILPIFSKGAVSTPEKSGRILASLLLNEQYQGISGKYFDRDKMIPSSDESLDEAKWTDMWQYSCALLGIE